MINLQPIEKVNLQLDGSLDVFHIWPTIQGEGPFAGLRASFVRLAGCNLACAKCDTDYTSSRKQTVPQAILAQVRAHWNEPHLVVITGGEPFRQNLCPLIELLWGQGFRVQIETNGTLWQDGFPAKKAVIVCSPKTPKIHSALAEAVTAWKYVLAANAVDPNDGLPTSALGMPAPPARPGKTLVPIYLQPQDDGDLETNRRNTQATVDSCLKYGYRLCLQLHKLVGLE